MFKYDEAFDIHTDFVIGIVDQAMADGNNAQLGAALHSITELAKSSPFKDLADLASVRAALDDPDHEWTFWSATVRALLYRLALMSNTLATNSWCILLATAR